MSIQFVCRQFSFLVLSGLLLIALGCGSGEKGNQTAANGSAADQETVPAGSNVSGSESNQAGNNTATQSNPSKTSDATGLEGIWYGQSSLDTESVNERLANLPAPEAERLMGMVKTFQSIEMAAQFRPDQTMEIDMMITTSDGQQFRDRSVGTWKVVEEADKLVKIQTTEYVGEQKTEKLYLYRFVDQNSFQFVPDSVNPELFIFSPKIVFERLDESALEDAALAEEPKKTEIR